ncbi:hypothetical protein [Siminovitchia fortis]|uniref:Uncharacterized protein n=1 Tax=Siminovitchia fortis TaxID=254758 RepID=A0A443IQA7_9BACI|nr:hypothetical protein [Siminovitchia fortis]RWR08963.1 hypothetical protein D4N35_011145 [Siminovitchia fortis]WHY81396.1 hypothetical protein QNH23_16190 [Siminovitchia fortis]
MKKVFWIIAGVLLLVVLFIGVGIWFIKKEFKEDDPEFVLELIKDQAASKNVGGSTAFVLTNAMYAEDKKGNRTEFAFFANDLGMIEQMQLTRKLNSFQLKILTDPSFRSKVKKKLGT